jgi:uncharacterized protein YkwD
VSRMIRLSIVTVLSAALFAPATSIAEGKTKSYEKVVSRAAAECPDADLDPDASNLGRIRTAILCLHNQIRSQRGLPTLRTNKRLRKAAVGHSRDMVANDYFEHTTPKGVTMVDRILRAHYVRADQGWSLGENLAWGTGSYATPRGAVDAWMNSEGHRENILRRAYREVGIGIVVGVPSTDGIGATYTLDFGVRR